MSSAIEKIKALSAIAKKNALENNRARIDSQAIQRPGTEHYPKKINKHDTEAERAHRARKFRVFHDVAESDEKTIRDTAVKKIAKKRREKDGQVEFANKNKEKEVKPSDDQITEKISALSVKLQSAIKRRRALDDSPSKQKESAKDSPLTGMSAFRKISKRGALEESSLHNLKRLIRNEKAPKKRAELIAQLNALSAKPAEEKPKAVSINPSIDDEDRNKKRLTKSRVVHSQVLDRVPNVHRASHGAMLTNLITKKDATTMDLIGKDDMNGLVKHVASHVMKDKSSKRKPYLG